MSLPPSLHLDWCSHEAAKYAVGAWHYSHVLPTPPLVKIGVWEGGVFIGCVVFSRGAAQNIGKPYGLQQTEIAELTRVALTSHRAPVSQIVSIALRLLKKQSPGLRLIVSFADPLHQHVGAIYQAGNWIHVGQRDTTTEYLGPDGKMWHGRMISPTGRKRVYGQYRAVWTPSQCRPVTKPGKYKYLMALDGRMQQRIAPLRQPYPKRERKAESGRPIQSAEAAQIRPVRSIVSAAVT